MVKEKNTGWVQESTGKKLSEEELRGHLQEEMGGKPEESSNKEAEAEQEVQEVLEKANEVVGKMDALQNQLKEVEAAAGGEKAFMGFLHKGTFTRVANHLEEVKKSLKSNLNPQYLITRVLGGFVAGDIVATALRGVAYDIKGLMGGLDSFAEYVNNPKPGLELFYSNPSLIIGGVTALCMMAGPVRDAIHDFSEMNYLKKQKDVPYSDEAMNPHRYQQKA
jgi:hypothetical protein